MQLQIETTNVCQADCVFCAYSRMTRPKGTMPLDLFSRIVAEAATIPAIDHVTLTGLGEPLLDRHLIARIREIRAVMPKVEIDVFTNGALLTEPLVDKLIDAGLSVLYVSLNAINGPYRQAVMRLPTDDYDQVVAAIRYATIAGAGKMSVTVKGVAAKDLMECGDTETFMETWGGASNQGGQAFLHLEGNWAGTTWPMRIAPHGACHRALGQIMVLWDGRVSLCCFDADGQVVFGDLNTQTLREVFNGPLALGVREAHIQGRRDGLPLCATCTAI